MAKGTFYALTKVADGSMQFLKREGTVFPNSMGLDLYLYHYKNETKKISDWSITEGRSGLALAHGETKKEVTEKVNHILETVSKDDMQKNIDSAIEKWGCSPMYRATYL